MTFDDVIDWLTLALSGMAWGALAGLIPLAVGKHKNRLQFGAVSMAICMAVGLLGGIVFGLPTAIILTAIILILGKAHSPSSRPASSDNNRLSSEQLAALVVDALVTAHIVEANELERAIEIAAEEITARKAAGDY